MSQGGDCDELWSLTRCLEFFPLEYMAEMATAGSAGDLYAGHEQRLVLVSIDGSWDGYRDTKR